MICYYTTWYTGRSHHTNKIKLKQKNNEFHIQLFFLVSEETWTTMMTLRWDVRKFWEAVVVVEWVVGLKTDHRRSKKRFQNCKILILLKLNYFIYHFILSFLFFYFFFTSYKMVLLIYQREKKKIKGRTSMFFIILFNFFFFALLLLL